MEACPNCGCPVEINDLTDKSSGANSTENLLEIDAPAESEKTDLNSIDEQLMEMYPEESYISDNSDNEDADSEIDNKSETYMNDHEHQDDEGVYETEQVFNDESPSKFEDKNDDQEDPSGLTYEIGKEKYLDKKIDISNRSAFSIKNGNKKGFNKNLIIGIVAAILVFIVIVAVNSGKKDSTANTSNSSTKNTETVKTTLSISKPIYSSAHTSTIGQMTYYEPEGWRKKETDDSIYYYPDKTSNEAFIMIQGSEFDDPEEVSGNEEKAYEEFFDGAGDNGFTLTKSKDYKVKNYTFKKAEGQYVTGDYDCEAVMYVFVHNTGIYSFNSLEVEGLETGIEEYLQELVNTIEFSECIEGHDMSEWTVTKEATCTEEGARTATCNRCGETIEETIPMTDHVDDNNWVVVTNATASSSGLKATHCATCGKEMQTEKIELTTGQKNVIGTANSYLDFMAFSRSRLIEQLEFEGYSTDDATFAVDNITVDWNEQAAKCAKSYLEYMSFSKCGLIEQLQFEGFTYEQAVYGVEQNGY